MKELICIVCPNGCHLQVDEKTLEVKGYTCDRGEEYGRNEISNPTRVITGLVRMEDGRICSVKTSKAIPKTKIFDVMDAIKPVVLKGPINIGDIVLADVCGTGANWIATKKMPKEK